MITGSIHLKFEYEHTRLLRYGNTTQSVYWAPDEILNAYLAWANHPYGREHLWDAYCDKRDGVPAKTNARIRNKRGEARFH